MLNNCIHMSYYSHLLNIFVPYTYSGNNTKIVVLNCIVYTAIIGLCLNSL